MASYSELLDIATTGVGSALRDKIKVAVLVSCDKIRLENSGTTNHANRLLWAKATVENPGAAADKMLWAVLAQNRSFTSIQITDATDAAVQTAVDNAVDLLAQG